MTVASDSNSKLDSTVDPVEEMLKRTGCVELHYEVQDCIVQTQDWRKCQEHVKKFKDCMDKYQKRQHQSHN